MAGQELGKPPGGERAFFYGYIIVTASVIITAVMWAVYYAFGVFFRPVLDEFGWSSAVTSGAFSLSAVTNGCFVVAMGGLTDKVGPRVVMTVCGLTLGLGYMLMSQISSIWHFYLFYGVIIGAGMSGSFIPLMSTVVRWFVEKRGLMSGVVAASIGLGALIGPKAASRLISAYGWRFSYVILGGAVLTIVILAAQFIKRDPSQVGQVAYGADRESKPPLDEKADGVTAKEALSTGQFWVLFSTGFCYGYCIFVIVVHLAPHAIELGVTAADAANILAAFGGSSIPGKIFFGRIGDIIGNRCTMLLAFILMSVALSGLAMAEGAWALYGAAALFGFSYGGCTVSHSPLVAILFGLKSHGVIFGFYSIGVTIGGAIGPFLTGHLFDVTGGYRSAFLVCSAVSFVGIMLTVTLKQRRVNPSVA